MRGLGEAENREFAQAGAQAGALPACYVTGRLGKLPVLS